MSYFGINVSKNLIVFIQFFFWPRSPLEFLEYCCHSQRYTSCLLFCWTVIECFAKTNNRPKALWGRIISVIWQCHVLNVLMSREQMLKKWLMSFFQKKLVPSSFYNQILYQKTGYKCDALHDLVTFVQFKKREKHPWRKVNFNKVNTPPWLFFMFFNLYKWYQIAQRIANYNYNYNFCP